MAGESQSVLELLITASVEGAIEGLGKLGDHFVDLTSGADAFGKGFDGSLNSVIKMLGGMGDAMVTAGDTAKLAWLEILGPIEIVIELVQMAKAAFESIGTAVASITPLVEQFEEATRVQKGLQEQTALTGESFDKAKDAASRLAKDGLIEDTKVMGEFQKLMQSGLGLPEAEKQFAALKDQLANHRREGEGMGEAMDRVTNALSRGKVAILEQYGVNAGVVQQLKDEIAELDTKKDRMTAGELATARNTVVMRALGASHGDAADYATTYEGAMARVHNGMAAISEAIGSVFQPAWAMVANFFAIGVDHAKSFVERLTGEKGIGPGLSSLSVTVLEFLEVNGIFFLGFLEKAALGAEFLARSLTVGPVKAWEEWGRKSKEVEAQIKTDMESIQALATKLKSPAPDKDMSDAAAALDEAEQHKIASGRQQHRLKELEHQRKIREISQQEYIAGLEAELSAFVGNAEERRRLEEKLFSDKKDMAREELAEARKIADEKKALADEEAAYTESLAKKKHDYDKFIKDKDRLIEKERTAIKRSNIELDKQLSKLEEEHGQRMIQLSQSIWDKEKAIQDLRKSQAEQLSGADIGIITARVDAGDMDPAAAVKALASLRQMAGMTAEGEAKINDAMLAMAQKITANESQILEIKKARIPLMVREREEMLAAASAANVKAATELDMLRKQQTLAEHLHAEQVEKIGVQRQMRQEAHEEKIRHMQAEEKDKAEVHKTELARMEREHQKKQEAHLEKQRRAIEDKAIQQQAHTLELLNAATERAQHREDHAADTTEARDLGGTKKDQAKQASDAEVAGQQANQRELANVYAWQNAVTEATGAWVGRLDQAYNYLIAIANLYTAMTGVGFNVPSPGAGGGVAEVHAAGGPASYTGLHHLEAGEEVLNPHLSGLTRSVFGAGNVQAGISQMLAAAGGSARPGSTASGSSTTTNYSFTHQGKAISDPEIDHFMGRISDRMAQLGH